MRRLTLKSPVVAEIVGYLGKLNGVGLFSPEKGAFDVFGNTSEMISIKGVANHSTLIVPQSEGLITWFTMHLQLGLVTELKAI